MGRGGPSCDISRAISRVVFTRSAGADTCAARNCPRGLIVRDRGLILCFWSKRLTSPDAVCSAARSHFRSEVRMRSPVAGAGALAVGALLIAGCSNGGPAPAPTVTVTTTAPATSPASTPASSPASASPAVAGPGACQFNALKVTLGPGNAAAGSQIIPIQFTNVSARTCTLYGFPGVSFTGETYAVQVGPAAVRNHASTEEVVTLRSRRRRERADQDCQRAELPGRDVRPDDRERYQGVPAEPHLGGRPSVQRIRLRAQVQRAHRQRRRRRTRHLASGWRRRPPPASRPAGTARTAAAPVASRPC